MAAQVVLEDWVRVILVEEGGRRVVGEGDEIGVVIVTLAVAEGHEKVSVGFLNIRNLY